MRRIGLAYILAWLALSVSGLPSLMVDETCSLTELAGQAEDEDACPPTCVTCGCCVQAAEPVVVAAADVPDLLTPHTQPVPPGIPPTAPLEILHVPRLRLA